MNVDLNHMLAISVDVFFALLRIAALCLYLSPELQKTLIFTRCYSVNFIVMSHLVVVVVYADTY